MAQNFLDNANWECFPQAQNFCINGSTFALSLATEKEASQKAGIAFNCGAS